MKASMKLFTATINGISTFQLIPIHKDCPFMEAVFERKKQVLEIIHPHSYETLQMMPQLDGNGDPVRSKQGGYKRERLRLHQHFSYKISTREEVESFIEYMTGDHVNLDKYYEPLEPIEPKAKIAETENKKSDEAAEKPLTVVSDGKQS